MLYLSSPMGFGAGLKKLRASRASLRKNSQAEAWKVVVPDLTAELIVAPEESP